MADETGRIIAEVAVETVAGARIASEAGADRLELCAALAVGGITPSVGLIRQVRRAVELPIMVLVRCRPGNYCYTDVEIEQMAVDIGVVAEEGCQGVVIGALDEHHAVHPAHTAALISAARSHGLSVTFHRAFDEVPDRAAGLATLIDLGADRVLTSAGAPTAMQGGAELAALVTGADGRIGILAGGGVTAAEAAQVLRVSGVSELHFAARATVPGDFRPTDRQAVVGIVAAVRAFR